jgi:hypothetical protein
MILGNIEKFNGDGLVGFIDILGYSKEIEEKWNNKDDNPLYKLLELKKHLPIYSNKGLEKNDIKSKAIRRYICRVQTISDSIFVSFGFNKKVIYGDIILGTIAFFNTIAGIWRNAIEVGFTIRGAVDFGPVYWDKKEIIGPSFLKVYKLEQNYAKTSRIILSSVFNKNIKNIFEKASTFWNDEILKILRKDNDGYLILNPHKLYNDEKDKIHLIKSLQNLKEKARLLDKEKYVPLLTALNAVKYNLSEEDLGQY